MCVSLKSILNRVQPIKGFVYESVRFSPTQEDTIEVTVVPRTGAKPRCHQCGGACAIYDHMPQPRTWRMAPLWILTLVLRFTMRRVNCPRCGVVVEQVPWASGKHQLCDGFRLFLAHWARKLSWREKAQSFRVGWADVYASVPWVVEYGLKHRVLEGIRTLGVDEVCVRLGRVFWSLVYQIDEGATHPPSRSCADRRRSAGQVRRGSPPPASFRRGRG